MIEETVLFPTPFYVALVILGVAFVYAWRKRELGVGIPMGAVLGTVTIWYFGDAFYNDYASYSRDIGEQYVEAAWWQVALFLAAFLCFVPLLHSSMNRSLFGNRSEFWALMRSGGVDNLEFQRRLDIATRLILGLMGQALIIDI